MGKEENGSGNSAPIAEVSIEKSAEEISHLQQSQPEISVEMEQSQPEISNEKEQSQPEISLEMEHIEIPIKTEDKMLQKLKEELWDVIRKGDSNEIYVLLESVTTTGRRRRSIKGINSPFWEGGPPVLHIIIRKRLEIYLILMFINLIPEDELIMEDDDNGDTALHVAIRTRDISSAVVLLERKSELAVKRDNKGVLPVQTAIGLLEKELSFDLYQITKLKDQFTVNEERDLLLKAVSLEWFEMVMHILLGYPELRWDTMENLLTYFLNERRAFGSTTSSNMLQSFIYSRIKVDLQKERANFKSRRMLKLAKGDLGPGRSITKVLKGLLIVLLNVPKKIWEKLVQPIEDARLAKIHHHLTKRAIEDVCSEMSTLHVLFDFENSSVESVFFLAAQNGIHEMVEVILQEFPNAINSHNDNGHTALDIAAMYRQEKVFMFLLANGQHVKEDTQRLFKVAEYALQSVLDSGSQVVFQMQRELKWFKEMEKLMPEQRNLKNSEGRTPIEVFKEKHQKLIDYENKWMLEMANSCIIGGSLIATVVFAASITVPGGNNNFGRPIFANLSPYQVFTIANGLAFTFSLTSVLVFLSIFTARYSVNDYLYSLPSRIIFGLIFLFLAVTLLMVDFATIMYLVSGPENRSNVWIVAASACIPIGFFTYLQVPSLVNMIKCTFSNHALKETNHQTKRLKRVTAVLTGEYYQSL